MIYYLIEHRDVLRNRFQSNDMEMKFYFSREPIQLRISSTWDFYQRSFSIQLLHPLLTVSLFLDFCMRRYNYPVARMD